MRKRVFVSALLPNDMCDELKKLKITPVRLPPTGFLRSELKYHPDMIAFNYYENRWVFLNNILPRPGLETVKCEYIVNDDYPNDCVLNNIVVDESIIICGDENEYIPNSKLFKDFEIIKVNQGYVRCSTIPLNGKNFITSDKTIYSALRQLKKNCLYVENVGIGLRGYNTGFIGGCSGVVGRFVLFTGNLDKYKQGEDIKDFCKNIGKQAISLSNQPLYDYGSLLPF